ncbi:TPA: hypothetical protein N0F65_011606 [Lagenidium giganteum]|uniref:Uncharacterized protein n=1 Tax=Lagenidium giganteum TaxID=4803 RepID=A0AAV2Z916_9STRA|nr:TPA: hypothetical protein N0F65_011606 [Lagenidium giganteum]
MTPPDPGDYSRFVDSRDEPDLSQHKIDEKNEKCQFHNCPNRARVSQAYGKFCNRHVIVAPCGFPGCRDKAMMNSSMCDKHLAQGKEALHKILANRAQNVPVCRTFGCFKNDQGRGYCRGHEKLLMATGRLPKHINKRRLNSAYTMCSYPDCNKHSQRNHLCRTHGNMIIKQAEEIAKNSSTETYEEVLSRLQKDIRKCTHPNCTKNSQRDRLCTMHYYEKNNIQREGSSAASKDSDAAVCSIPDCNLQVFAKNMCKYHSGQGQKGPGGANAGLVGHTTEKKKCSMTGCNNQMFTSGMCAHHYKQSQIVSITSGSVDKKCEVSLCNSLAVTGSTLCEQHRGTEDESQPARLHPVNSGRMMTDSQSVMLPSSNTISSSMGGFGGSGGDGSNSERQVPSVGTIGRSFNPQGVDNDPKLAGMVSGSICGNPICQRESYGHEFCASCQSLFSPLVVSVGDCNAAASYNTGAGIPSSAPNVGYATWNDLQSSAKISDQSLQKSMVCRVKDCNASCVRGGLCLDHIRLFEDGGLSVDELAFHSRQNLGPQNEREDNKDSLRQPSPLSNSTKYFCSENGCQNPAQSKGLCQRHFRLHHDADSTLYEGDVEQSTSHSRTTHGTCHFPDCSNNLANETVLCPSHAQACFCWYPSCEKLVDGPQFCDFHAYRRQCAFEGCHYAVSEDNASSCSQHAMARRCSHEYCDKFAVEAGDRCRLHLTGCDDEPCALCEVHSLDHDGISNNNEAVSLMNLAYGKANSENVQAGNFAGNAPGEEMMEMPSLRNGRLI